MTVWNLGSINADFFYQVAHLPRPGETLAAASMQKGLGGKGANMSVAISRAGGHVHHIGAVGTDGQWAIDQMNEYGVDVRSIQICDQPTAHAIITVDDHAENSIVIFSGANLRVSQEAVSNALTSASTADYFVTQNETNLQFEACKLAKEMGLKVAYAAAPFSVKAVSEVLPFCDLLILNEVEAEQLRNGLGKSVTELGVRDIVVTLGSKGAQHFDTHEHIETNIAAIRVDPVDTTGAGDTFTGYLLAELDKGQPITLALEQANRAAALMVTRFGTADVIPDLSEVRRFKA